MLLKSGCQIAINSVSQLHLSEPAHGNVPEGGRRGNGKTCHLNARLGHEVHQ